MIEVKFKRKKRGRVGAATVVHAKTRAAAESKIAGKFTGCTIESVIELKGTEPKYFVIADLEE